MKEQIKNFRARNKSLLKIPKTQRITHNLAFYETINSEMIL